jgi:hypothetical protein
MDSVVLQTYIRVFLCLLGFIRQHKLPILFERTVRDIRVAMEYVIIMGNRSFCKVYLAMIVSTEPLENWVRPHPLHPLQSLVGRRFKR